MFHKCTHSASVFADSITLYTKHIRCLYCVLHYGTKVRGAERQLKERLR